MKRSGKRGQFYLIAALAIIVLIMALALVVNYSRREEKSRIYELGKELEIEAGKVLDYGAITTDYPWDAFTKNFTDYAGGEIDITYVVGNFSSYDVFYYDASGTKHGADKWMQGSILTVTHNQVNYSFNFQQGENFYFVMSQDIEGEYYVTTN